MYRTRYNTSKNVRVTFTAQTYLASAVLAQNSAVSKLYRKKKGKEKRNKKRRRHWKPRSTKKDNVINRSCKGSRRNCNVSVRKRACISVAIIDDTVVRFTQIQRGWEGDARGCRVENTGRLTSRATVYNAGNTICRNLLALDTRATPAEISFLHRIAGVYRVYRPPTSVSGDRVKSLPSPLAPPSFAPPPPFCSLFRCISFSSHLCTSLPTPSAFYLHRLKSSNLVEGTPSEPLRIRSYCKAISYLFRCFSYSKRKLIYSGVGVFASMQSTEILKTVIETEFISHERDFTYYQIQRISFVTSLRVFL